MFSNAYFTHVAQVLSSDDFLSAALSASPAAVAAAFDTASFYAAFAKRVSDAELAILAWTLVAATSKASSVFKVLSAILALAEAVSKAV